jgi:hypothetical protein
VRIIRIMSQRIVILKKVPIKAEMLNGTTINLGRPGAS